MKIFLSVAISLLFSQSCLAYTLNEKLHRIETEWEQVHYHFPEEKQPEAFLDLLEQATVLTREFPERAEPIILQAAIILTHAAIKNPFSALSSVNQARDLLRKAIALNPDAKKGSAFVTLGTLYYKVPGWPVSFGNNAEAERLLLNALEISPYGIDSNYYYAEYLTDQGRLEEAQEYFERVINAPVDPNMSLGNSKLLSKAKIAFNTH